MIIKKEIKWLKIIKLSLISYIITILTLSYFLDYSFQIVTRTYRSPCWCGIDYVKVEKK